MKYNNILLLLLLITIIIISIFIIVINISSNNIKSKEYIILLLVITFITISVFYIINIMGIYKIPYIEDFSVVIGGSNCSDYLKRNPSDPIIKTTYDNLKNDTIGDITGNYHTDYTCEDNFSNGIKGGKYSSGKPNTYDIGTNEMLLAYMCINKSPRDLKEDLESIYTSEVKSFVLLSKTKSPIYDGELNSGGRKELMDIIARDIRNELKINEEKVPGPVYICLSQAPYIYEKNSNLSINFSITKHGKSCHEDGMECDRNLYLEYLLIYPNINSTTSDEKLNEFITIVKGLKSTSSLCWLNCNMEKDYGCGCLSYEGKDKIGVDYTSKCTPSDTEKEERKGIKDYSIIYFINPYMNDNNNLIGGWYLT